MEPEVSEFYRIGALPRGFKEVRRGKDLRLDAKEWLQWETMQSNPVSRKELEELREKVKEQQAECDGGK